MIEKPNHLRKLDKSSPVINNPILFPITGLIIGLFFWFLDAFIDVYILKEGQDLLGNIFSPDESTEIWMRSLVVIVFFIMGLISRKAILKHIILDELLYKY